MTDDVTYAVRAVLASYDAGDDLDVPMLSLKLALSERERAHFRDEANRYWLECSALRAQLDDAQRERYDYAAAVDVHRDRIAELERMVGEREGRIGGLEYDVAELTATLDAQRARSWELELQLKAALARIAELERTPPPAAPPPDLPVGRGQVVMPGRLAGAARAAEAIAAALPPPPDLKPPRREGVPPADPAELPPCPHCDQRSFKSQIARTQHVNYCPKNPARLRAPNSKAERAAKIAAAQAAAPPEQRTPAQQAAATGAHEAAEPAPVVMGARFCQFCRAPFSPKGTALELHEPRCPENPNRIAPPDLARQITLSVDSSEVYCCPDCGGTAFAKSLTADRCMNCENKRAIGKAAA